MNPPQERKLVGARFRHRIQILLDFSRDCNPRAFQAILQTATLLFLQGVIKLGKSSARSLYLWRKIMSHHFQRVGDSVTSPHLAIRYTRSVLLES